jgi:hypothetical protein
VEHAVLVDYARLVEALRAGDERVYEQLRVVPSPVKPNPYGVSPADGIVTGPSA